MFTYLAVIIGAAMLTAWIGLVSMLTPVIGSAHDEVVLNRVTYRAEAETMVILKQLMNNPTLYPSDTFLTLRDNDREKLVLLYNRDTPIMTKPKTSSDGATEPDTELNTATTEPPVAPNVPSSGTTTGTTTPDGGAGSTATGTADSTATGTDGTTATQPGRESIIQVEYTEATTHATVVAWVHFRWVEDASGARKMQITMMVMS